MTVKVKTAENNIECFETNEYIISPLESMNPLILSVEVYSGPRLIARRTRPFKWFYKHVTFKSRKVQAAVMEMRRIKEASLKESPKK